MMTFVGFLSLLPPVHTVLFSHSHIWFSRIGTLCLVSDSSEVETLQQIRALVFLYF